MFHDFGLSLTVVTPKPCAPVLKVALCQAQGGGLTLRHNADYRFLGRESCRGPLAIISRKKGRDQKDKVSSFISKMGILITAT